MNMLADVSSSAHRVAHSLLSSLKRRSSETGCGRMMSLHRNASPSASPSPRELTRPQATRYDTSAFPSNVTVGCGEEGSGEYTIVRDECELPEGILAPRTDDRTKSFHTALTDMVGDQ